MVVFVVPFLYPFVHTLSFAQSSYDTLGHLWGVPLTLRAHQAVIRCILDLKAFGDLAFGCVVMKGTSYVHSELHSSAVVYDVAMLAQH